MTDTIAPIDSYQALDGTRVEIPPPRALEDGPMPRFGKEDEGWLAELIAFRDRAVDADLNPAKPDVDPALIAGMDPRMRALMDQMDAQQAQQTAELAARLAAARRKAETAFGADGLGFLDWLNQGVAPETFWPAFDTLMFQRIPLTRYAAPKANTCLRDLVARFPERLRVPILALRLWPRVAPRKSDPLDQLLTDWLASPVGDFRHLETGPAKPMAERDLGPDTRKALAQGISGGEALFAAINAAVVPAFEEISEDEMLSRAADMQRLLMGEGLEPGEPPRLFPGEAAHVQLNAYRAALRQVAPGHAEGMFLLRALSPKPYGFHNDPLHKFPRHAVWPYVATHLDILDRALGVSPPFSFEPKMKRSNALLYVEMLPKTPKRYEALLTGLAAKGSKGMAATAQGLLDRG